MASLYDIRHRAQQTHEAQQEQEQSASSTRRDYRAIYRAVHEYHERHNPPRLAGEYWQSATEDVSRVASALDNDPFAIALLQAVYGELEREYIKAQQAAGV